MAEGVTRGPDAVRAALIEAAATLFADQGDASVRTIARAAGVNHGLVHHYFGGKAALRNAVIETLADRQAAALAEIEDAPIAVGEAAWRISRQDSRLLRILARAVLDGEDPRQMQDRYPVVQRLVEAFGPVGGAELVAAGLAMGLGVQLMGPWISASTGVSEERLAMLTRGMLEP